MYSYTVVSGDTFEKISKKSYGTEVYSSNIKEANPGTDEPLIVGTNIIIPENQNLIINKKVKINSKNKDQVTLLINDNEFKTWVSININTHIDNTSSISAVIPFQPEVLSFRETFKPFSYPDISVYIGEELIFSGTIINVSPNINSQEKTMSINAYARCGILNDCTAPISSYPIEYDSLNILDIANNLLKPFGLKAKSDVNVGAVFDRVSLETGQKIINFLSGLAKQRGLIMSSDENGDLLFLKSNSNSIPVAYLRQGEQPLINVTSNFNSQDYYSHISGIEPVVVGLSGERYTVKNPYINNILRPYTFEVEDSENGTLQQAVESKAGRMFGNMVNYKIVVNSWRDNFGNLWKPNTIINLQAENAMIYNYYDFLIRSVSFMKNSKNKTAEIELVLRTSFNSEIPENLPWQ